MLQALRPNPSRQRVSKGASIPAPVDGWDASSPISAMDPKRAVTLDNFFPDQGFVRLRRGHTSHATGVGSGTVDSLMVYHGVSASKLFAAQGTSVYDATSAATATAAFGSATSDRWQHVNFTTSGGHFLFIVNGADAPRHYNGTTWATPSITGITPANVVNVFAHKKRLWFIQNASTQAAYMPLDSVAGAATTFELGSLFDQGGYLMAGGSWTVDSGTGPDDLAVFVSSRGQIAVYQGTDPASSDTWSLVGVFNLGAPIGRRCLTKVAGDLAYISIDGVVPLSKSLALDRGAVQIAAITANIQRQVADVSRDASSHFGWELIGYPKGKAAILNVPITDGVTSHQYVMNTISGAWCRYTGMNAFSWAVMDDRLYFGGAGGVVYEADSGADDAGEPISAELKTAFNYYGDRGRNKHFKAIRPIITTDGRVEPAIGVDVDYEDNVPSTTISSPASTGSMWNQVTWGNFVWGGSGTDVPQTEWLTAGGIGHCAAVHMKVAVDPTTSSPVTLFVNGFDMVYETGDFF